MTRRSRRSFLLPLLMLLAIPAACGAGGFGGAPAPPPDTTIRSYVALGDGFTSAPYIGKDTSGDGCLRSANNYPTAVAAALKITDVTDVSCNGATTKALTSSTKSTKTRDAQPAQLKAVTPDTDLITVGVGLMDRNLIQNMFHLCTALPCGTDIPGKPVIDQLRSFGTSLTAALRKIQDISPTAYIVVVGYPQLMPPTELCDALPNITDAQLDYANRVLDQVNQTLQSAARQTGSGYVDVAALSMDHNACSDVPWVNGYKSTKNKEAFHPVEAEQAAVAAAVVAQVRNR